MRTVFFLSIVCVGCSHSTAPTPKPTLTMSVTPTSIQIGSTATLAWVATHASSCTAGGAWSGTQADSGHLVVTPATVGSETYTLACTGPGGTTTDSAKLTVTPRSLNVANTFSPNATTISTSEGAPYGDCDFWRLTAQQCSAESNFGYGPTKVLRVYICLSGEVSTSNCSAQPAVTGPLSAAMLNDIDTRLAAYAGLGIRLIVRFTYNFGPIGPGAMDAPIGVISNHIDQLAPIVLKYRDLVMALEAGFIGTWGEWHDSTNGNDTSSAQKVVLDKERSYFSGVFPILVRDPPDLIQYTGLMPQPDLGIHDDYYASNSSDAATWVTCAPRSGFCLTGYTVSQVQSYSAQVSTTTMFVGEFGALYPTLQSCSALMAYSYTYHPQSINIHPYPTTIGTELVNEGCALAFYNKAGTRIELVKATVTGTPTAKSQLTFSVTLVNTGFGRVIRARPGTLILLFNGNDVAVFPIPLATLDLRQLVSAASPVPQTFQFTVTLPSTFPTTGSIAAVLEFPDPAPSLTSQAAYALPLNSVDQHNVSVFDPTTGYNTIATFGAQ